MTPTRSWLHGFLHLGARAADEGIPSADVTRQEDTILHALETLETEPGVVLADEVGMGKTFEALGLIAAVRTRNPSARVLVLTPGPDLNAQWMASTRRFREDGFYDLAEADFGEVGHLRELPEAVQRWPIVFAPVSVFLGGRDEEQNQFLLGAWQRWARLREETRKQIASAFMGSRRAVPEVLELRFLDSFRYGDFSEEALASAFQAAPGEAESDDEPGFGPGLQDLYDRAGTDAFEDRKHVLRALARARFRLLHSLMPVFDLLVVDEAHKLKNPNSMRSQAVTNMLLRRYRKTAFLTATPFQLGISELEQVFRTFAFALDAPAGLLDEMRAFFADIEAYQATYASFEEDWCSVDPAVCAELGRRYEADPALSAPAADPNLRRLESHVRELSKLKRERIEPRFRRWMIRSVRHEKAQYRQPLQRRLAPEASARIPFLVYERLVTEVFREGAQTYKAAAEVNVASSFQAALAGALLDEDRKVGPGSDAYRKLLREVLEATPELSQAHPKLAKVAEDAFLAATARREKTLIFSERVESIRALRKAIHDRWIEDLAMRWARIDPSEPWQAQHERLRDRFHKTSDPLYLALRENYVHTLAELPASVLGERAELLRRANAALRRVRTTKSAAERFDHRLAKRCVEQAAFGLARERGVLRSRGGFAADAGEHVLDGAYLESGLDLVVDDEEADATGDATPAWELSDGVLDRFLGANRRGIWAPFQEPLGLLDPATRVRLAEALASFFTKQEVAFLPDLLGAVRDQGVAASDAEGIRDVLEVWWLEPKNRWRLQLEEFVRSFVALNPSRRATVLEDALKSGQFVRDTLDDDARERLKEAFNTPFYPMVLVANPVMQEGIDLHRHCRRVVHHDLAWNPATLEQRVGRVDRIGSLVHRKRAEDGTTKLEIHFPLVDRTIDVRQYERVMERERWLGILLGAPPELDDGDPTRPAPPPLPERLVEDLTIRLAPKSAEEGTNLALSRSTSAANPLGAGSTRVDSP